MTDERSIRERAEIELAEARFALERQWKLFESIRSRSAATLAAVLVGIGFISGTGATVDGEPTAPTCAWLFIGAYALIAVGLVANLLPAWDWRWTAERKTLPEWFDKADKAAAETYQRPMAANTYTDLTAGWYWDMHEKNAKQITRSSVLLVVCLVCAVVTTITWPMIQLLLNR